jgi:outer membrane protein assembly factor BamD (BamD/ComL family)
MGPIPSTWISYFPQGCPMARQILKDVQENLALGNFKIAQFYASKAYYAGATSRLKTLIEKYPNFSRIDEVNQLYKTLSTTKQPSQSPQGSAK